MQLRNVYCVDIVQSSDILHPQQKYPRLYYVKKLVVCAGATLLCRCRPIEFSGPSIGLDSPSGSPTSHHRAFTSICGCGVCPPGGIIYIPPSLGLQHIKVARSSQKDHQYLPPQTSQQGQLPSHLILTSSPTYHAFIAYIAHISSTYPSSPLCLMCATFCIVSC